MPSPQKDTVPVTCPKCGHVQPEPRTAYSTRCKSCHEHFRVQEALRPAPKPVRQQIEQVRVTCFQCGTELEVPKAATSTMCKRCSSHVDLTDYQVTQTVSKNFRTHGRLVVEEKGYVLNTEARVGDAVIKGRLIGKLNVERSLELHSSANIKGTFTAGTLVIPAGQHFSWPERLRLGGADIAGELAANVQAAGTVRLQATARFFGDIEAANLVVEEGAVFVGAARIGAGGGAAGGEPEPKPAPAPAPAPGAEPPAPAADEPKARPKPATRTGSRLGTRTTPKPGTGSKPRYRTRDSAPPEGE